jgi:hypothetical protein
MSAVLREKEILSTAFFSSLYLAPSGYAFV